MTYSSVTMMIKIIRSSTFFNLCSILIIFLSNEAATISIAEITQPFLYYSCRNERGNYTTNSTYQANLDRLLSNIVPSKDNNGNYGYGFYNSSYGENSNQVHAIGFCRGDVKLDSCRSCLNDSIHLITEVCPNKKEAIGMYTLCMLRYSDRNIFGGGVERFPRYWRANGRNVSSSNVDEFFQDLRALLNSLKSRATAASSGFLRRFATGNATAAGFKTLYALVQCTPDLSSRDCNNCLDGVFEVMPECCSSKVGGRVLNPSCNFRYETFLFYDRVEDVVTAPASPLVLPPPPPTNSTITSTSAKGKKSNSSKATVIAVISTLIFVVLSISICVYFIRVKRAKKKVTYGPSFEEEEDIINDEFLQYDFGTINDATDNFSVENKLGEGGFGAVYRGRLPNGEDIAVKRLSTDSGQGELEFKNEVLLLAKLQHRNLVKLRGFCLEGSERLLLYEFVPNGSLDRFIFDPIKRANFDWDSRYKIIQGIARGLLYLHEDSRLRIIHRDLKASNILLNEEMNPKISDFGMARLFVLEDQTQDNTRRVVGTYGYMAPEYAKRGRISFKSDVFSFGVLLLEILSGQRNGSFRHGENTEHLLSYTWRSWRNGTISNNLVDPLMRVGSGSHDIMRCVHIGLLCGQENVAERPTMNSIVLMLNSHSFSLPIPSHPAFLMHSDASAMSLASHPNSGDLLVQASRNEATISELHPR
ncbi:cysteine-rich receptor-like protein kinase 26 [Humulus lupulus]|uniref:cysteine-rich receptor-like protein kinase 26 n=1 Tax=Humulus lupulus TaxID=3486 RepID=UPI002B4080EE|nr:cysteine-rich receptor-like protein kinase 26 [Humulus lupulus]